MVPQRILLEALFYQTLDHPMEEFDPPTLTVSATFEVTALTMEA